MTNDPPEASRKMNKKYKIQNKKREEERMFTAQEVRQAVWEEIMRELTHLDVSERTERAYEVTGLVMAALEHYE